MYLQICASTLNRFFTYTLITVAQNYTQSMLEKVKLCYEEHFRRHVLLLQALYFLMRLIQLPPKGTLTIGA